MDGGGDPERQQALEQYKNKLLESREWEAKLKDLRMGIKGLQSEFETTEENIKALQSVGQIIGEVLKQLDEERCMFNVQSTIHQQMLTLFSYRQSIIWSSIRRRLPLEGRQGEAQTRHESCPRYDYPHNHANAAPRSRSSCLQHVARRPWPSVIRRHWWS